MGEGSSDSNGGLKKDFVAWTMFERFDTSGSGKIGPSELSSMCVTLGRALSQQQLQEAMVHLDGDGDGQISFAEFYCWWQAGMTTEALRPASRQGTTCHRKSRRVAHHPDKYTPSLTDFSLESRLL